MVRAGGPALCACLLFRAICAEPAGVRLDVPFVKQDKNGCGPASIAMLMEYWAQSGAGISSPGAREIQRAIDSHDPRGTRGADMEQYLSSHGFRAFVFRGEWRDIEQHLSKGRPLIVCLDESHGGPLHYLVVAGFDPAERVVLLNDPARRKLLRMDRAAFEKDWKPTKNWTLLAVPQAAQ
ncbi:MAG TPA: C39 family peptidase [Bryobacteraceae bacterium]|nr:C39 family peptidase [Bryobacteraceae bacterium]